MNRYTFSNELKRTMNFGMVIAVIGVILCICFDSWNDLMRGLSMKQGTVHYFFQNSAFGGVCRTYFLPIFTTLPFSTSFCSEYKENAFPFIVAREGKRGYCITKYVINALCGGFVIAFGTALLFVLLASVFPVADAPYQEVSVAEDFHLWLAIYHPFRYGAVETANGFLTGVLWSCVSVCSSAYIPNSFVTMTSPYLFSFALGHMFRLFRIDNLYRFDKWLTGYSIIGSSMHTLLFSTIAVLIIISILGLLFMKKVRGRIENELYQ